MTYKQALAYLYDLEKLGIKLGLFNIKRLLALSGNPQQGLAAIHIAGTNGKGSTAAFISSILKEAGYKVGLYTSPHLTDFRERITINGRQIPGEKVAQLLAKIRPHIARMAAETRISHPTFFEVTTVIAFSYFEEEKVDFAVIEVGLGGRLDATNVLNPLISVITNSDYDHMDILGSEITSIAREHAGIIKREGLVITAARGEALEVIREVCQGRKARLYEMDGEIKYKPLTSELEGQSFDLKVGSSNFKNLKIPLLGRYQLINAGCAAAAAELLKLRPALWPKGGVRHILISHESIRKGLKKVRWPGRFEVVRRSPLVILDGAHNQPAAKQLKGALRELKKGRLILVIGILKDKEIENIVRELAPLAFKVLVTAPKTSRAASLEIMYKAAIKYNRNVAIAKEVGTAVQSALSEAKKSDTICVTGSLYTIGEARQFWGRGEGCEIKE